MGQNRQRKMAECLFIGIPSNGYNATVCPCWLKIIWSDSRTLICSWQLSCGSWLGGHFGLLLLHRRKGQYQEKF